MVPGSNANSNVWTVMIKLTTSDKAFEEEYFDYTAMTCIAMFGSKGSSELTNQTISFFISWLVKIDGALGNNEPCFSSL